jgi:hypothetical protein
VRSQPHECFLSAAGSNLGRCLAAVKPGRAGLLVSCLVRKSPIKISHPISRSLLLTDLVSLALPSLLCVRRSLVSQPSPVFVAAAHCPPCLILSAVALGRLRQLRVSRKTLGRVPKLPSSRQQAATDTPWLTSPPRYHQHVYAPRSLHAGPLGPLAELRPQLARRPARRCQAQLPQDDAPAAHAALLARLF